MNSYEEKKQRRIDYYNEKAEKLEQENSQLAKESSKMIDAIPMGQPLMPDHYSYPTKIIVTVRGAKWRNPLRWARKQTTIAARQRPPKVIPLFPATTPKRLRS